MILGPQERTEGRGGIEARKAQPVDAAVVADEGAGVAVADERIVLDVQSHRPILSSATGVTLGG